MPCNKCKERNECTEPCDKLRKELNKVTKWKNKREKSINPDVMNNHLYKEREGKYEWNNKEQIKKRRPSY